MGCQSKGMSKQRDVKAKGCQSKGISKQWDAKAMRCKSNGMSKQSEVEAKGCQSKGMPKHWDAKAMGCQSSTFSFGGKSCTKASFSHLPFAFWGKSRAKASFSHLPLAVCEGRLAQKLRFHIFHLQIVREVSHEIRFWKLADERNAVFCRTKRVLEGGWGSFSGRRVRNTFG